MWQKDLARAVSADYGKRKLVNHRYSQRAYARYLDVSSATVSQLLKGNLRWNLLPKIGLKILKKIDIAPTDRKKILHQLDVVEPIHRKSMKKEDYRILTDWTYGALHASQDLPLPLRAPEHLVKRFGLKQSTIGNILRELEKLGMLKWDATKSNYETTSTLVDAGDGPSDEMIQKHHQNAAQLSIKALREVPANERNFSAVTFVGSSRQLEEVRKEFRKFEDKVMSLMNQDQENDEVYQLSIGLFPFQHSRS